MADRYAERTKKSRQLRPWALLCSKMGWPVQLFPNRQVTDEEAQRTEMKVAMYAYYLSHEYASATVERYVGDLQAFQAELCDGRRAEELEQHFF